MTAWSPQQREWLQALGHDVLVLAGTEAPPLASPAAVAGPRPASAAARPAAGSPLLRALLRAAGRRDPDELAWLPDLATLRGDARAKRALWPRLRALRKPAGGA